MLILVLILALVRVNPEGAAIIDASSIQQCRCDAVNIYLRDNSTSSHFGTRGRNDIIVSCLATILACTWTTIHPNIPAPGESGWNKLKQKVVTWIYALLAPEAITAWAMRQYFGARWIADNYNIFFADKIRRPLQKHTLIQKIRNYVHEWMHGSPVPKGLEEGEMRPWTITHGFFFQMGGFMRCEKGRPVLCYRYMEYLVHDVCEKRIDAPTTTVSEIQDRSKGDVLSKTIVILQTTWFIAQCIARWSARLPVTELEVVTLGFAMLNALTYGFWWHKPQSVGLLVFLEMKMPAGEARHVDREWTGHVEREREQSVVEGIGATEGEEQSVAAVDAGSGIESQAVENAGEEMKPFWRTMWERVKGFWRNLRRTHTAQVSRKQVSMEQRSFFIRQLAEDRKTHSWWQLVWRMPYALVLAVLRPLAKLLQFTAPYGYRWSLRVPIFNTHVGQNETVYVASSIIASLFGLVHFIPAWFLDFPSRPERLLWRISAGIITGQPIILGAWSKWKKGEIGFSEISWMSTPVLNVMVLAGVPLYVISRLTLLVLDIIALRDLSPGALMSIEWVSFVPHL